MLLALRSLGPLSGKYHTGAFNTIHGTATGASDLPLLTKNLLLGLV
jgi:hypothetical protein